MGEIPYFSNVSAQAKPDNPAPIIATFTQFPPLVNRNSVDWFGNRYSLVIKLIGLKEMNNEVKIEVHSSRTFLSYLKRFTFTHVVTYLVCGLIFMNVMNYAKEFVQDDYFSHFRPLDSPIVRAAILFQFIRGAFIASILYPFRKILVEHQWGWFFLFWLIFGLTGLGAVNATPGSIEGMIYTEVSIKAHLIGMPEVITQSLVFSVLFVFWERKNNSKSD